MATVLLDNTDIEHFIITENSIGRHYPRETLICVHNDIKKEYLLQYYDSK